MATGDITPKRVLNIIYTIEGTKTATTDVWEELARVRAERDALLAAFIRDEPVSAETFDEVDVGWLVLVPIVHRYGDGRPWVSLVLREFPTREAAESAILAAAMAATEQRAKGGA